MGENKDLTSLGRYLNLLQEAMRLKENVPNKLNTEMFNKYYKLYSDEHVRLFGFVPNDSQIKNQMNNGIKPNIEDTKLDK